MQLRLADIAPISEQDYQTTMAKQHSQHSKHSKTNAQRQGSPAVDSDTDSNPESEEESVQKTWKSTQCLFCNADFEDVHATIKHMRDVHKFLIPSLETLLNLETFIEYLGLIVFEYNECLFCGSMKSTSEAVQTHMRDSGHCRLNVGPGSDLLEFWDDSKVDNKNVDVKSAPYLLSESEMLLPSGLLVERRGVERKSRARSARKVKEKRSDELLKLGDGSSESRLDRVETSEFGSGRAERSVVVRSEMGLVGLSDHAKRALRATDKRMQTQSMVAKAAWRHSMEQQPRKTVYYKVSTHQALVP